MAKIIKYSLITILSLFCIFILAAISITHFIDANTLKGQISQQVENATGRKLTIKGDVSWAIFPSLGIELNQVALANAKGFGNKPFATAEKINFSIKLLPLLSGNIALNKAIIRKLMINLTIRPNGQSNWQSIGATHTASSPTTQTERKAVKERLKSIHISKVDISDTTLNYSDQRTRENYKVSDINLKSTRISTTKIFPLTLRFTLSSSRPKIDTRFRLKANARLNLKQSDINQQDLLMAILRKLTLHGRVSIPEFKTQGFRLEKIKTPITASKGEINLSPISARAYGGHAAGAVGINVQHAKPRYNIISSVKRFKVKALFADWFATHTLNGTGDFSGKLMASGFSPTEFLQTLNGSMHFKLSNGAILGVDLPYLIESTGKLFKKNPLSPTRENTRQTNFNHITADAKVRNGILTDSQLLLMSRDLKVSGTGTADLLHRTLNYRLLCALQGDNTNSRILRLQKSMGGGIPILVSGTFAVPVYKLDRHVVTQAITKTFIEEQVGRFLPTKENLKKPAEGVKKVFEGIFNR